MGENKALLPFLGVPLVKRVVERVRPIAAELLIATNQPEAFEFLQLPLVSDTYPGSGALVGLHTALAAASQPYVAVVACDMPFASPALIEAAHRLLVEKEADIAIPDSGDGLEPLHSVYRRATCIPAIEAAIESDQWKLFSWFPQVKVHALQPEEVKLYDPCYVEFVGLLLCMCNFDQL